MRKEFIFSKRTLSAFLMILLVSFFVAVSSCGKGDDSTPETPNTDEPIPGNPDDPNSGVNVNPNPTQDPNLDPDRNENKDQNANIGKDNLEDIAVTGAVSDFGATCATIIGYININKAPVTLDADNYFFGISYTDKEKWEEGDLISESTSVMTGRQISVRLKGLTPNKTYYYHTYFRVNINGTAKIFRGQTLAFNTRNVANIAKVEYAKGTPTYPIVKMQFDLSKVSDYPEDVEGVKAGFAYSLKESDLVPDGKCTFVENFGGKKNELSTRTVLKEDKNIKAGTKVYYAPYTSLGGVTRMGEVSSFDMPNEKCYLKTGDATNISFFTAEIVGCEKPISEYYDESSKIEFGIYVGTKSTSDHYFDENRTYYKKSDCIYNYYLNKVIVQSSSYCVYAFVDGYYFFGEKKTFDFLDGTKYVSVSDPENLNTNSVTLRGSTTVNSVVPDFALSMGVEINGVRYSSNTNGESWSIYINDLPSGTLCKYRSYVTGKKGTIYSEYKQFSTPYVAKTEDPSIVKNYAAVVNGSLPAGYSDSDVSKCYFEYSKYLSDVGTSNYGGTTKDAVIENLKFSSVVPVLTKDTKFYYRAVVVLNDGNVHYGEVKNFVTTNEADGDYVDLGLSSGLLWCTKNLSISTEVNVGLYHCGEIEKALKQANSHYRLPTVEQLSELVNDCVGNKTSNGVWFVGSNANAIFVPNSGYKQGTIAYDTNVAYFWTSTVYNRNYNKCLCGLSISQMQSFRYMPVRPVYVP